MELLPKKSRGSITVEAVFLAGVVFVVALALLLLAGNKGMAEQTSARVEGDFMNCYLMLREMYYAGFIVTADQCNLTLPRGWEVRVEQISGRDGLSLYRDSKLWMRRDF